MYAPPTADAVLGEPRRIQRDGEGPGLAAHGVHLDHAGNQAEAWHDHPVEDGAPLHEAQRAADLEVIRLAERARGGAELRNAVALRYFTARDVQPFSHDLPGKVEVRLVVEGDGDDRDAGARDAPDLLQPRQAAHGALDGEGDVALHVERAERRGRRDDLHLDVGDVRDGVDGHLRGGEEPEEHEHERQHDDQQALVHGEGDQPIDQSFVPI
jgi:hypothetical protein